MRNFVGLALVLPLFVACSGNGQPFFDDGGTPTDDAGNPIDDSGNPPPSNAPLATGLPITDIAVFQVVKVNVVKNGSQVSKNAPIVAGRGGMVRVYVNPTTPFTHAITGTLTITTGGTPRVFTATVTPKAASTDASFQSTFNFNVDAAAFATDSTYLVKLQDPQGTAPGDTSAQFPTSGTATSLGVQSSGPSVKIKLFPIKFSSGGGTAATGSVDVAAYTRVVNDMYPTPQVSVTVMSPLTYSGSIPGAFDQNSWGALLNWLAQKRAADSTPDVYYYGGFAPSSSLDTYCGSGCIAGLSSIPSSPSNYSQKASIGLMYGGNSSYQVMTGQTMAHEVGHTHGREHSPTSNSVQGCTDPSGGTSYGLDPNYPYTNGGISVWGYEFAGSLPEDPSKHYDIMGYCSPDLIWISDYTYKNLFSWIAADNGADMVGPQSPTTYRMVTVDGAGSIVDVSAPTNVYGAVSGEAHTVKITDKLGVVHTVTGYYSPYDHIQGGFLWVPESAFTVGTLTVPDFGTKAITKIAN